VPVVPRLVGYLMPPFLPNLLARVIKEGEVIEGRF
jgi:hypothetical protein